MPDKYDEMTTEINENKNECKKLNGEMQTLNEKTV